MGEGDVPSYIVSKDQIRSIISIIEPTLVGILEWYDVKFIFLTWNCTWAVSLRISSRTQQLIAFGAHICNWMSLVPHAEWGFVHSWVCLVINYRNLSVLGLHQFPNKIIMELKAKICYTLIYIVLLRVMSSRNHDTWNSSMCRYLYAVCCL